MMLSLGQKYSPLRLRFPRFPAAVQFTSEGLIFVLLCLAIGAAAVNTGNNVLYLIFSLMLGMIVVSGIISRRILLGLKVRVDFPEHIFSGVKNVCYISVNNSKKWFPSVGIHFVVTDRFFPRLSRHFFYIPSHSEVHGFAPVLFPKRGTFQLKEIELQTRLPFSFFVKIRRLFPNQVVRVYPRIYRLSEEVISRFTEGVLRNTPYRGDSQQLLHLRDYSPFDSSKRIHWKASAKMEKWLVKEFEKEQGQELHLYFDCYPATSEEASETLLDNAINFLASVAYLLSEKGITGKVFFPGHSFSIGSSGYSMIPLLSYLADVKVGQLPQGTWEPPPAPDAVIAQIRSRKIPANLLLSGVSSQTLYVEDWFSFLREPVVNFP